MPREQNDLHSEALRRRIRTLAVRDFRWEEGLEAVKKPLHDLEAVVDLDALMRLAKLVQNNGTLSITFMSQEYCRVGLNWIEAMKKLKFGNFLVIAGDSKTCQILADRDVTHIEAKIGTGRVGPVYRSRVGFTEKGLAITALKFPIVSVLLKGGYNVIMSDADAIWLRDPLPHFLGRADLAFQRVVYFPAPIAQLWGFAACSGFVFFRHCPGTLAFVEDCIHEHKNVQSDQLALNLALLDGHTKWQRSGGTCYTPNFTLDHCDEELRAAFRAMARFPIKGRLDRYGLELLALAHHEFWRHTWVTTVSSDIVVCHPNSPKNDLDKIKCFEQIGVPFLNDHFEGATPASLLGDRSDS